MHGYRETVYERETMKEILKEPIYVTTCLFTIVSDGMFTRQKYCALNTCMRTHFRLLEQRLQVLIFMEARTQIIR